MTRIEGQVAEVVTERDLVINRGAAHGVKVGMRFKILHPGGSEVIDPETNTNIGSVEVEKTIVKVVSVQENLSVARTYRSVPVPASGTKSIIDRMVDDSFSAFRSNYTPPSERMETLRRNEPSAAEKLEEDESYVRRGDPAVQVLPAGDLDY